MPDDPATRPDTQADTDLPSTPADAIPYPEEPPMDDEASGADVEDEAAKLGDFA